MYDERWLLLAKTSFLNFYSKKLNQIWNNLLQHKHFLLSIEYQRKRTFFLSSEITVQEWMSNSFYWTRMIFADFEMFSFRFNAGDFDAALPLLLLLLFGVTDMLAANLCWASRMAILWFSSSSSSSESRWQNFRLFIHSSFSDKLNIENAGSPVEFIPKIPVIILV